MKRMLIFLSCLVLGPILGCFLSGSWHTGANTFWKPIDYFPHPVKNIMVVKPYGKEFWVETTENEIYQITYPCSKNQICWAKADIIPTDIPEGYPVDYKVSNNKCENRHFVYPLLHKITMCVTLMVHVPDATWTTSVALTTNKKLWIWDQPWEDPFTIYTNIIMVTAVSTLIGFFTGIIFLAFSPSKRKGKHN